MNIRALVDIQSRIMRGFASKLQAGSTKNNKDSAGRRLGVKKLGANEVQPNDILIRQRGFKWHAGNNTYVGKDHTIHSKVEGYVRFERSRRAFNMKRKMHIIHVIPRETANRIRRPAPYVYHPELFPEREATNPEPMNLKIHKPTPHPILYFTQLGKGTLSEEPRFQSFISVTQEMVPIRRRPATVNHQILKRVNSKISTLIDEDIQISFNSKKEKRNQQSENKIIELRG